MLSLQSRILGLNYLMEDIKLFNCIKYCLFFFCIGIKYQITIFTVYDIERKISALIYAYDYGK